MTRAQNIIKNTLFKWRLLRYTEIVLVAVGIAVLVYFLSTSVVYAVVGFFLLLAVGLVYVKPWNVGFSEVCNYLDNSLTELEHSTALLLAPQEELTLLAKIQQAKTAQSLAGKKGAIRLKHQLLPSFIIGLCCAGLGALLFYSGVVSFLPKQHTSVPAEDSIAFKPLDTVAAKVIAPVVEQQQITVRYPAYTGKAAFTTTDMNVKVLQGASVRWEIGFNQPTEKVWLQFGAEDMLMNAAGESYQKDILAENSTFYSLKFLDTMANAYLSDMYAFEVYTDESPTVGMSDLPQYATFEMDEQKEFDFIATITDDFGISDAVIIATVSKGTGESVKFREEKLVFDTPFKGGDKGVKLKKSIDLNALKMEAGDELYFYVEATDTKTPKPNITRTETYFAVIKDTATDAFAVEGTMGADLMPAYFRSQRQLIIDTEKLIADKPTITTTDFNFRSNELGFDQKALRIKYGEFMGDETEGPTAPEGIGAVANSDNMLDQYSHKHDTDNEHNLVAEDAHDHDHDHDHGEDAGNGGVSKEDPLEAYVHNHGDPEASTLFAKSLKSMLKDAMAQMWDAELYLRLFEPEKSLPHQYKALKLIQEIKNSARIYVHRIGFDPPPIKENTRLTGELKDIKGYSKTADVKTEAPYPNMLKALELLERLMAGKSDLSLADKGILKRAGDELAVLAIAAPSRHLETLQGLRWLSQAEQLSAEKVRSVHGGLLTALPVTNRAPSGKERYTGALNQLFLDALEANE